MYFLMILAIAGSLMMFYPWRMRAAKGLCAVMSVMVFLCWGYVECAKFEKYSRADVNAVPRNVRTLKMIAGKVDELTNGDAFVDAQLLLYYLHGNPKLLFHVYSESLIQAKTEQEIKQALHSLRVGAIVLQTGGGKYSLLPLWDYINEEFICISSTEFGKYVIFLNPEFIKGFPCF